VIFSILGLIVVLRIQFWR